MKVLLLQNVKKLGQKNQIIDVNDGYAQNFLIRQGLAKPATNSVVKSKKDIEDKKALNKEAEEEMILNCLIELKDKPLKIERKSNDKGVLFSAIHLNEIINLIKDKKQVKIDSKYFIVDNHKDFNLKEVGEHEINYQVGDKKGFFLLIIS